MKGVELYVQVRRAVYVEGLSRREAARRFGIDPRTVAKMLAFSVPPGYRRSGPPLRPKLDPFVGIIDRILEEDKARPAKQQHTSKRIFERLRDEHGYTGGITVVKEYVQVRRLRSREMFVPLRHDPGHAQIDFGEALVVIGGVERKTHFFAMELPHSDACLVQAYPSESSEAFCEGHRVGFEFFGGEKRLLRLQRQLASYKLLIIDELGYVPLSQAGAELLFEVFSRRYERGSVIVTSNLPFDEWTGVFGSERLTGALLDRLTHHVHILEMNGDSFRLKHSRARLAAEQPSQEAE